MFHFLHKRDILHMHTILIDEYGGVHGLRDDGILESALAAAENRAYYENADLASCAATYAFHLCEAHAFLDGNKRIAAMAAEAFFELNGAYLALDNERLEQLIFQIAAGEIDRNGIEQIFQEHTKI
ncbi:MAG: type II toxin-antitoxin system death-on-curing family toxin [Caldilineaceae bacterium]|nr:type II toxin-antitoxin system death-on-curing family toxin [Caldilineaceae bacterium]MCB9156439.1 type II toxin-antitoxin system death-on-curing family toxin [Caldilineaceae bacterium]